MCLAIYKPATTKPDKEAYRNGFESNAHGAGFAAAVNGALIIGKGFFKFESFWEAFQPYADCPALVHFRYATHGKRDEDNCHPFSVSDNLAMIHNGVLPICTKANKDKSDTWHYVESVLKPLHSLTPEFYKMNAISFMGSCAISGSKFIFLRADGDCAIWNEDDGLWAKDGHWYSNRSFEKPIFRYTSAPRSKYDDEEFFYIRDKSRDKSSPRSSQREAFPDYDADELAISAWGLEVPADMEWVADELLQFGYRREDIEQGFADDPDSMFDLLQDEYDLEEGKEAKAYGLNLHDEK